MLQKRVDCFSMVIARRRLMGEYNPHALTVPLTFLRIFRDCCFVSFSSLVLCLFHLWCPLGLFLLFSLPASLSVPSFFSIVSSNGLCLLSDPLLPFSIVVLHVGGTEPNLYSIHDDTTLPSHLIWAHEFRLYLLFSSHPALIPCSN